MSARVTRMNPVITSRDFAVNVRDYGAAGTGSDDTAAFQAAIDAAPLSPFGVAVVQIPDGTYTIRSALVPKSNLIIQGIGNNTILDFSNPTVATANLFDMSSGTITDFTVRNFTAIGNGRDSGDGSAQAVAVRLSGTSITRFTAKDVAFINFRYGIRLGGSTAVEAPRVNGCRFYGCAYAGVSATNTQHASIIDNYVDASRSGVGNGTAGVVGLWVAELATGSAGHTDTGVHNNHVIGTSAEGINVHAKYASVTGNNVASCAVGVMFEPYITTSPAAGDVQLMSTISGNSCRNNAIGIAIRQDPSNNTRSVSRVAVTGNLCQGGTDGIRVGMAGASSGVSADVTISGNACFDQSTVGIIVYDAVRVALSGNVVVAAMAVYITGTSRAVSISGGSYVGTGSNNCALSIDTNAKLVTVVGGNYTATGTGGVEDAIRIAGSYVSVLGPTADNVQRSGIRVTGTSHDVSIHAPIFLDDQGTPTMDNGIQVTSTGANITLDGNPILSGPAASYVGLKSINGVGVESSNAETPTAANWRPGNIIDFTDSGDASGNGRYLLGMDGTTWFKIAGASSGKLTTPLIDQIKDTNGNTVLDFTATASAVNYLRLANSAAGSSVAVSAAGADTNINVNLIPKGSGGVYVNGVQVATISGTQTLTNKRVTPRVSSSTEPGGSSLTPDGSNNDLHAYTALSKNITINAPSGTPTDDQPMRFRFKDNGTGRTLTWDAIYRAIGVTIPTTTVANKTVHITARYNSADTKWDVISVAQEA